ncbi:hypothetical protein HRR80_003652 [Exophiala dermatitidis]|uniref:Uncharacterized protein n=1 Tax=Exophiala dermatitidis TaxID=5970 RepID=A0AAN6IVU8_EXODE|nr:hypothetical protein HRR91_001497 [Exophiala dermatitidis]KAJ4685711.1 hypothetical protein HRR95_002221 [Exophiala dermatitidis]KAJ8992552.1 hypothetical protein HRR80_003652 [Exophiala dermatitidis]
MTVGGLHLVDLKTYLSRSIYLKLHLGSCPSDQPLLAINLGISLDDIACANWGPEVCIPLSLSISLSLPLHDSLPPVPLPRPPPPPPFVSRTTHLPGHDMCLQWAIRYLSYIARYELISQNRSIACKVVSC